MSGLPKLCLKAYIQTCTCISGIQIHKNTCDPLQWLLDRWRRKFPFLNYPNSFFSRLLCHGGSPLYWISVVVFDTPSIDLMFSTKVRSLFFTKTSIAISTLLVFSDHSADGTFWIISCHLCAHHHSEPLCDIHLPVFVKRLKTISDNDRRYNG